MLLQANNLSCVREDRTLFEHLSFAVRSGDLMQIEGPNGVGKTSLLRLLTGLSQPFAGEVCWNGRTSAIAGMSTMPACSTWAISPASRRP